MNQLILRRRCLVVAGASLLAWSISSAQPVDATDPRLQPATQPAEGEGGRGGSGGRGGGRPPAVPLRPTTQAAIRAGTIHNVTLYGAKGDGVTIDSDAINAAIDAAAANGGGTVYFPAGVYASYSIRLKSNITLHLDH